MLTRTLGAVLVMTIAAAACQHHQPVDSTPALGAVLPNIPFPPGAQPVGANSGKDATQLEFLSNEAPDSVAAYYRKKLASPPFQLVNETTTGKTTTFYAEQKGPSIWVTVEPSGTAGTRVTISGALQPDSTTSGSKTPGH
jgi:hypothetical protein